MEEMAQTEIAHTGDPINAEGIHVDIVTDFEVGSLRIPEELRQKLIEKQQAVAAKRRAGQRLAETLDLRF